MTASGFRSAAFWLCYSWCGISDIPDGFLARKLKQQSAAGAKLDGIADLFFAVSLLPAAAKHIYLPAWFWLCMAVIALLRPISYSIAFFKYRTFSSQHTFLNKITGISVFAFPLLYLAAGLPIAGSVIGIPAFISAVEETVITKRRPQDPA